MWLWRMRFFPLQGLNIRLSSFARALRSISMTLHEPLISAAHWPDSEPRMAALSEPQWS